MKLYAEDSNYWDTTVHPAKSLGEVQELLEEFGVKNMVVTQGRAGTQLAWIVRFQIGDRTYRFGFMPKPCRTPDKVSSFGGKRRTHDEQARYQMGRTAVWFVKAILTAAQENETALFGFVELPEVAHRGGMPATAGELNIQGLVRALPDVEVTGYLEAGEAEEDQGR